jgi:hypothetical protein
MTSVTIEQLGYMSNSQLQQKICSIKKLNSQGLYVYPCHQVTKSGCGCGKAHKEKKEWGKHPSNNASHHLATNDPNISGYFWSLVPECNVGVNPKKSSKVVIDIDPRSSGHTSWLSILEELEIDAPPTWKTITGVYELSDGCHERGTHLWFEMPFEYNFPSNLNALGYQGIDIKFNGGVLVPPSMHGSGVAYEWEEGFSPDDIAIAEMPESLLNLILRAAKPKVVRDVIGYRLPPANAESFVEVLLDVDLQDGTRNVSFYRIACQVAYWLGCFSDSQISNVKALLDNFNQTRVHPPLDERDNYEEQVNRAISFVQSGGAQ